MNTILMNSETADPPRLLPNLSDKIMLLYQTLAFTIYGKI